MWKQIRNYNYEINEQGIVKNIRTGKIRNSFKRRDGYIGIQLYIGKVVNFQLHRLLAEVFISNPENKKYVNHKDSNRSNNSLDNLEWVTLKENVIHGYKYGNASNVGSSNGFSKLNEEMVYEIKKKRFEENMSYKQLADAFDVSYSCISGILQNRNWTHVEYLKTSKP